MSGIAQQPNWENFDKKLYNESLIGADQKKAQLAKNFEGIQKTVKDNPENINRISNETLKNLKEYISFNKDLACDMYMDVYSSLQNSDKLDRKDKKSLEKIKILIEEEISKEKIWEHQLAQEINENFWGDELKRLKKYGESFNKSQNITNWFRHIPEEYKWDNSEIEAHCKDKLYTSKQFVKKLYDLNQSRQDKIEQIVSRIDVSTLGVDVSWSFDAGSHNAQKIVTYIKAQWWEIIHDYREYPSFVTADVKKKWENDIEVSKKEEENSKTESESGKASEEGVAETETNAAVEVVKETIDLIDFNASSIIEKIEGTEKNWYNNVSNKAHIEKAINEISKIAKEKSGDKDLKNLVDLLKQWNIRRFQIAIWLDEWNAWNQADGKIWEHTLKTLNEFIKKKEEGNNADEVPNETNSASSSVTNSAESRNASNTAPETPIEYSIDFIKNRISKDKMKDYVECFKNSNFKDISKFFTKFMSNSDIDKDDIKNLQKDLLKDKRGFNYRWKWGEMFTTGDVDGIFWPKTLAKLEDLYEKMVGNHPSNASVEQAQSTELKDINIFDLTKRPMTEILETVKSKSLSNKDLHPIGTNNEGEIIFIADNSSRYGVYDTKNDSSCVVVNYDYKEKTVNNKNIDFAFYFLLNPLEMDINIFEFKKIWTEDHVKFSNLATEYNKVWRDHKDTGMYNKTMKDKAIEKAWPKLPSVVWSKTARNITERVTNRENWKAYRRWATEQSGLWNKHTTLRDWLIYKQLKQDNFI